MALMLIPERAFSIRQMGVRRQEHERLEHEDDRHPLVVGYLPLPTLVVLGHPLVERDVVGVVDPAVEVRVLLVVDRAHFRAPAVDGLAEVLPGADQDRHQDEGGGCVEAAQSVRQVVVQTELELLDVQHGLEHVLHDLNRGSINQSIVEVENNSLVYRLYRMKLVWGRNFRITRKSWSAWIQTQTGAFGCNESSSSIYRINAAVTSNHSCGSAVPSLSANAANIFDRRK